MPSAYEESVRSLYLPVLSDGPAEGLLVPAAVVAEIVGYRRPGSPPTGGEGRGWLLGSIPWRGGDLPVAAPEVLLGRVSPPPGPRARIAILHALGRSEARPHYGLVVTEMPSIVLASEASVRWLETGSSAPAAMVGLAEAAGRRAWIPDLDELERGLWPSRAL